MKGEGNQLDFGARIHDPRLGQFMSVDPWDYKYPYQSPYLYAHNNPIALIDYMGLGDPPTMNLDQRHLASGRNFRAKDVNSVIVKKEWQNKAVLEKFFNEAVQLVKNRTVRLNGNVEMDVTLSNGTKWNVNIKTGHFYPVEGDGIVNLSKQEMVILQSAYSEGAAGEAVFENIAKAASGVIKDGKFSKGMMTVLDGIAESEGVSAGSALGKIGKFIPHQIHTNGFSLEAARSLASKMGPNTVKALKWGGRTLFVVAVANDVYEIYNAKDVRRTAVSKAGGWAGSIYGATLGTALFSETGPGAFLGGLGGGIFGYYFGKNITETVYDFTFEKVK